MSKQRRTVEERDDMEFDAPLTLTDAADIMGVSVRTIGRYIADGWIGAVRMPNGRFRVRRSAVMAVVEVRQLAAAHNKERDA